MDLHLLLWDVTEIYEMNIFLHEGINAFHRLVDVRSQCNSTTPLICNMDRHV